MAPTFTNTQDFFFSTPLYAPQEIDYDTANSIFRSGHRVDGWCKGCGRESTFIYSPTSHSDLNSTADHKPHFSGTVYLKCVRDENYHVAIFHIRLVAGVLQKIGQYPSFADISQDQSKTYAKLLGSYASEFHKAIGLAAHGVGIGSFVYMRRIFEKLIQDRFDEFKDAEKWSEKEFREMRMAERVQHLKDHLPDFLVRNTKLYSIMSRGIHELDEETCLSAFNLIKGATIIILEEDQKKKEELARQAAFEKEIAAFDAPKPVGQTSLADLGVLYVQTGEDAK
ncbi:hypothetical protein P0R31_26165 [Bradyrhizobium yuanmingense]|uniref:hypothetical protein n=1 Tax=Bradyrhizobium yuanmingense TaxID=108015 RepID=UPI0023B93B16|nr:hypothetical protein [Bradyrhizobium yuanmingense]MDF0520733.1 hypothetical protein [Bradyrhizobium yuanmingense]